MFENSGYSSQPQGSVQINWGNPLSRSLSFAHTPSLGFLNLVDGKYPLSITNSYPTAENGLLGRRFLTGVTAAEYLPNGLNTSGNSLTLLSIWRAKNGNYIASDNARLLSCRTVGNAGWSWGRTGAIAGGGTGNLTYQTMVFQGVAQYIEATPTIASFVDTTVVCRISGTTASWFARGAKSSADTTVGTLSTGGNLVLFAEGPFSTSNLKWDDREYLTLAWRRALSDSEIANISSNPWQVFQRRNATPIFTPTGDSGVLIPDLNSPGVIDVTSNSAKPELNVQY